MKRNKLKALILVGIGVFLIIVINYQRKIVVNISCPEEVLQFNEAIIYFGRDSCPNCRLADKVLLPYLRENDLYVYYFDTDQWREHKLFNEILEQYHITEVPVLIRIKEHEYYDKLEMVDEKGRVSTKGFNVFFGR